MEKIPPIVKTYVGKEKEITLHIPNVRYAKENYLLQKKIGITHEMIEHNLELCGFEVVCYGEHKGVNTRIITKCCNVDCDNTCEKWYTTFIAQERLPLCNSCISIVRTINRINKRPMLAIKGSQRIEFESVAEAGRQLNINDRTVYNHLKRGTPHSSGYRFEFLD
ncbi:hypothetical protein [Peribacillus simplex]|uniref:hypothetical protein n=1 Tax=Peribacillus simplex TaxID=1478 RepID=UPI003D27B501